MQIYSQLNCAQFNLVKFNIRKNLQLLLMKFKILIFKLIALKNSDKVDKIRMSREILK